MKIIYLDCPDHSVTGGHKYNDAFLDYLSKYSKQTVVSTPSCALVYKGWGRLFAPILELKKINLIETGDIVFWNDTSYKYHLLLISLLSIFKRIHSIVVVHHFLQFPDTFSGNILKRIYYAYLSRCGEIVVPSPFPLNIAKKAFPNKDIKYIPIPFEKKYSATPDYQIGKYLYVGTIEERKGLHLLVDALNIIHKEKPDFAFSLDVVGKITDNQYYIQLKTQISNYNLTDKVHFCGRISDKELDDYYNNAEIFTFPSLLEGYGIVLVEAMYKGVPVVCFDNSAMPYSIHDGVNGFLAENKNAHSLAEKIILLSGNKELRLQLQEGIIQSIQELKTKADFEQGIRELYNNLVK